MHLRHSKIMSNLTQASSTVEERPRPGLGKPVVNNFLVENQQSNKVLSLVSKKTSKLQLNRSDRQTRANKLPGSQGLLFSQINGLEN